MKNEIDILIDEIQGQSLSVEKIDEKIIWVCSSSGYLQFKTFMIKIFTSWRDYSYIQIVNLLNRLENEMGTQHFIVFFGKYMKVDLTNSVTDKQLQKKIKDYFEERISLFYFLEKYDHDDLEDANIYLETLREYGKKLIKENAIEAVHIKPKVYGKGNPFERY